jgi:hypothetical protein
MEKLEHYRQCIRKLLTEQATLEEGNPDIECQLIFDGEHDHYQLLDDRYKISCQCCIARL